MARRDEPQGRRWKLPAALGVGIFSAGVACADHLKASYESARQSVSDMGARAIEPLNVYYAESPALQEAVQKVDSFVTGHPWEIAAGSVLVLGAVGLSRLRGRSSQDSYSLASA
jgi:ElaB/YqjD/DUF883 family membrane-anchored ribosome-binding protein